MDFKIIEKNENTGSIVVRFIESETHYIDQAVDIPIVDGAYLSGDKLNEYIKHLSPIEQFSRMHRVKMLQMPEISLSPINNRLIPLDELKSTALSNITKAVFEVRAKYSTPLLGQTDVYEEKLKQANEFLSSVNKDVTNFPYVELDAVVNNITPEAAAGIIISKSNNYRSKVLPATELIRIRAKSEINNCSTEEQINQCVSKYTEQLKSFN